MTWVRRVAVVAVAVATAVTAPLALAPVQASADGCPSVDPVTGTVTPAPSLPLNWPDCDLTGANLTGTNLGAANLAGANLTGANLAGATLSLASLAGATLTGVRSGGINASPGMSPTLPSAWSLVSGYLVGPGANLTGASLSGANLADSRLAGANLTGAHLSFAHLERADLTGTTLTNTDFAGAYLDSLRSGGIVGTPTMLASTWKLRGGFLLGPTADLTGADLTGVNLAGIVYDGVTLADAKLAGATLTGLITSHVIGTPASLPSGWKKTTSNHLVGPTANLTDQDLTGIDLAGISLAGATLSGTKLAGATLTDVRSGGITGTPASLPTNWVLRSGYLLGPGADVTDADLGDANLAGVDLTDATLSGVASGGITGTPASLPSGWHLRSGYLLGPGATLAGASLSGADLSDLNLSGAALGSADLKNANLTGTTLTGAKLKGANLTGATLTGVRSGSVTGPATLPSRWRLVGGYLIGPRANLAGADLVGLNLQSVDLTSATLTGASFAGSDLTGATLTGAAAKDAVWTGTTCMDGGPASDHVGGSCLRAIKSPPGLVRGLAAAFPVAGKATITWSAPSSSGSSPITAYQFCRASCGRAASWTSVGLTRSATLKNLVKGRDYTVLVRARNAVGAGEGVPYAFRQGR